MHLSTPSTETDIMKIKHPRIDNKRQCVYIFLVLKDMDWGGVWFMGAINNYVYTYFCEIELLNHFLNSAALLAEPTQELGHG